MSTKRELPYRGKIKSPLDSLYGEIDSTAAEASIAIEQIQLPPRQPRRYFDPLAQQNLVQSVRQHGILQPLLVRPLDSEHYELVAGERRYRAAKEVGLMEVPIVVRQLSDTEALQFALIENLQREDLNPIEETEAVLQLLAVELELPYSKVSPLLYRLKHESDQAGNQSGHNVMPSAQMQQIQALFERLGLMAWQSFVKNRLPLLKLPTDILEAVMAGDLQYTKATALNRIKDGSLRAVALEQAVAEDWSVNQIRAHIKQLNPRPQESPSKQKQRFNATCQKARKTKIWDDLTKQARFAALLADLEALVEE